jgi:hypothetical protein
VTILYDSNPPTTSNQARLAAARSKKRKAANVKTEDIKPIIPIVPGEVIDLTVDHPRKRPKIEPGEVLDLT